MGVHDESRGASYGGRRYPSAIRAYGLQPGDLVQARLLGRSPAEWSTDPDVVIRVIRGVEVTYRTTDGRQFAYPDAVGLVRPAFIGPPAPARCRWCGELGHTAETGTRGICPPPAPVGVSS